MSFALRSDVPLDGIPTFALTTGAALIPSPFTYPSGESSFSYESLDRFRGASQDFARRPIASGLGSRIRVRNQP